MARPFNVRMDDDLKAQIRRRVDSGEASNQSEWAREALAGVDALGGLPALARAIDLVGGELAGSPHPFRARVLQSRPALRLQTLQECPHPDAQRIRLPSSERCSLCGTTLREDPEPRDVVDPGPDDDAQLGMSRSGDVVDLVDIVGVLPPAP